MDLEAYFARIGWSGAGAPDLAALQSLAFAHACSIPFENVDTLLGTPVALDMPSIERKLVRDGRGGYCFEHNLLLAGALRRLGFGRVEGLAARVMWNRPGSVAMPQTHMLLRVVLDGEPFLVDAGFGGLTLTGVLREVPDVEQATPHETFRLIDGGMEVRVDAKVSGEWRALYRFDPRPREPVDFEVANHWISTHPTSHFRTNLMAARASAGERRALLNGDFAVHRLDGRSERRRLRRVDELRSVLEREFLLRLPAHSHLDARLDELLRQTRTVDPPS